MNNPYDTTYNLTTGITNNITTMQPPIIIGSGNMSCQNCENILLIGTTNRDRDITIIDEKNKIFIAADNGIMIEVENDKFIDFKKFYQEYLFMKSEIGELKKDIEFLKLHMLFQPGGDGYHQAENHFNELKDIKEI